MFIGNQKQVKFLKSSVRNDTISQTYLFSGPSGVGKFTLAKNMAEDLTNGKEDKLNTDLLILAPEVVEKKGIKKEQKIKVEAVREMQAKLNMFPSMGKYRVLIMDNAHKLSKSAQNALLKTLEEPNKTSIIILISSEDGNLLGTVKSRVQKINFSLVSLKEINKFIAMKTNAETAQKIAMYSMGRPGMAVELLNNKILLAEKQEAVEEFASLRKMNIVEKTDWAEKNAKNQKEVIAKLEFWIWLMRVNVYKSINLGKSELNLDAWLGVEKIAKVLERLKNPSLNHRLILENLLMAVK